MDWFLRQWNERSFAGWKQWWQYVALIAFGYVLLATWLRPSGDMAAVSIAVYLRTVLLLGASCMALAWMTSVVRLYSWRAALAGWSRLLPLVMCVPVIDAGARWLSPRLAQGSWWFGPRQLPGWLVAGWVNGGIVSLGMSLLVMVIAGLMIWRALSAGESRGKAALLGILALLSAWGVFAVPSLIAWTRLSTYGTTFAPTERVVEQAFARVWVKTPWYDQVERFLDVRTLDARAGSRSVTAVLAWLFAFGVFAPTLSRMRYESWKRRVQDMGGAVAPVIGGVIMGSTPLVGQTGTASALFWVFVLAHLALVSRVVRRPAGEDDPDERWFALAMLFVGAFLLGWTSWLLLVGVFALLSQVTCSDEWLVQAGYRGAGGALLFLFGWSIAAGGSMAVWTPALLLGVIGLFKTASILLAYHAEGRDQGLLIGSRALSPRMLEQLLLMGWMLSILLVWWGVGRWMFGVVALVLALFAPATLWLLPLQGKRATWAIFLLPLLLGLLLHPGIFVP